MKFKPHHNQSLNPAVFPIKYKKEKEHYRANTHVTTLHFHLHNQLLPTGITADESKKMKLGLKCSFELDEKTKHA